MWERNLFTELLNFNLKRAWIDKHSLTFKSLNNSGHCPLYRYFRNLVKKRSNFHKTETPMSAIAFTS